MKYPLITLLAMVSSGLPAAQDTPFSHFEPTRGPAIFYPGSVSTFVDKFNTSFSPDLKTIYYTATSQKLGVTGIAYQTWKDGAFGRPEFVPFADAAVPIADVQISPDGDELWFSTFREYEGKSEGFHFDLWSSRLGPGGEWQQPSPLRHSLNSKGNEFYPVRTTSGNLYFNSDVDGNSDVYRAEWDGQVYRDPVRLPDTINTDVAEADAFVSPDESFILFVRVDAPDGQGNSDLYISFNQGDGNWSQAKNLGPEINSSGIDGSPHVTSDQRFLLFTSDRKSANEREDLLSSYGSFEQALKSHRNGSLNFYYVSFDPADFKP